MVAKSNGVTRWAGIVEVEVSWEEFHLLLRRDATIKDLAHDHLDADRAKVVADAIDAGKTISLRPCL